MLIAELQEFSNPHRQGNSKLGYKEINAFAMEVIGSIDVPSKECFF